MNFTYSLSFFYLIPKRTENGFDLNLFCNAHVLQGCMFFLKGEFGFKTQITFQLSVLKYFLQLGGEKVKKLIFPKAMFKNFPIKGITSHYGTYFCMV